MYVIHNTTSGPSKDHGNTNTISSQWDLGYKVIQVLECTPKALPMNWKERKSQTLHLNKMHSGAKPMSYPFLSPAAVYPNDFRLQRVLKWLERNEVSFSTLAQHHFSLPLTILRFETISSFGLLTSVISFKEIHNNYDIYLKWNPFYWDRKINIVISHCLYLLFDFMPAFPYKPQWFSGCLLSFVLQVARF